jgi:hypothetical protein
MIISGYSPTITLRVVTAGKGITGEEKEKMKRSFLCVLVICLFGAGAVQASAILAGPVPLCTTFAVDPSNINDLAIQYGVFSAANFACEQQDKIYSNFALGALPTTSTLRIQLQPLGGVDFHTVTFNGNFAADFTVSYDIAIDLALSPTRLITSVTGDISNPSNQGSPSNLKSVFSEGGSLIGSLTSVPGNPGLAIKTANTALHVTDVYTANGGAAVSISNTFREDLTVGAPETYSYLLVGGGFLLLASLRRFRRRV